MYQHVSDALRVLALCALCTCASGCRNQIVLHNYDKAPLDALNKFEPEYRLDDNGRVVEIKLEHKQLDVAAFDQLGNLRALQVLSLYGSSVTDADLIKLQSVGQLEALGLGATAVTDSGLAHLAELPKLHWLWLNGTHRVTAKGVADLKNALPQLIVYR